MNDILLCPLSTEKSVKLMDSDNKITFIVDKKSTKKEIKEAMENNFKVKVEKVNTLIQKGKKKAYIKLSKDNPAIDIATKLGIM